jgi:enamine deaminase RidA (YjgF/YER057c/UK114 family)
MDDIIFTAQLRRRGVQPYQLLRLQQSGELTRLRRGAYVAAPATNDSPEQQHRRQILATLPRLAAGAVISHGSAAVLHRLPVWPEAIDRVHLTRNRAGGGKSRRLVQVHGTPLEPSETVVVDGVLVTSLARTVVDLCRTLPYDHAVAAGDKALASGLIAAEADLVLSTLGRGPGTGRARQALAFLDGRSESAGESMSRVLLARDGLPPPELQHDILDSVGRFIARPDFTWRAHRTVGEFDGRIKYGRLLQPGQHAEDVIYAEKVREDALRDLGWQVVRWIWADLYRPGVIRDRLTRAFARGT